MKTLLVSPDSSDDEGGTTPSCLVCLRVVYLKREIRTYNGEEGSGFRETLKYGPTLNLEVDGHRNAQQKKLSGLFTQRY